MSAAAAGRAPLVYPHRPKPGPAGWLRIILRLLAAVLLLALVLPCLYLWRIGSGRRVWPRLYFLGFCRIIGLQCRVEGRLRHNAFLLPNHVGWLDIPALLARTNTAFIAHDGLAGHPAMRWFCGLNDTVFIARHRRSTVGQQVEQVRDALERTGALTLFPEGTTSDGTRLHPFKSALLSAIEPFPADIVVQPVCLAFREPQDIAWIGEEPGLDNFLYILARRRPVRLTIHLLEPLAGDALADRKRMAAAAQVAVQAALDRTGEAA